MVLTSARPSDHATVSVTIQRAGVLAFGDRQYTRVFNAVMRHCLQKLKFQQVSDNVNKNFNPLNANLNPICHLLALLGAHHILHISRVRVNLALNTLKMKDRLVSSHHSCSFACVMCACACMCACVHACTLISVTVYYNIIWNLQLIIMTVNLCTVTGMAVRWSSEIICIKFNGMWTCTAGHNQ
jgi:hypothetical protein